jgi:N-acetyl-gamma-glutamylphosphate reductase
MAGKVKVTIVGASGLTGRSIAQALLASPEQFVCLVFHVVSKRLVIEY